MTKYIVTFRVSVLSRGQYWSTSTEHQSFSVTKKQMSVIHNHIVSMIILQTKITTFMYNLYAIGFIKIFHCLLNECLNRGLNITVKQCLLLVYLD